MVENQFERAHGVRPGCGSAALGALVGGLMAFLLAASGGLALLPGLGDIGTVVLALALSVIGGGIVGALIGGILASSRRPPDPEE